VNNPKSPSLEIVRQVAPLSELTPFMVACMHEGCAVRFTVRGNSMLPFLVSDRDAATLIKPDRFLKKGDVPLYLRDNGKYVLHRVIKANNGVYTMLGDAQHTTEPGIRHDQIIGLAVRFERNGKDISCSNLFYRFYSWFWRVSRFCRFFTRRMLRVLRRIIKRG